MFPELPSGNNPAIDASANAAAAASGMYMGSKKAKKAAPDTGQVQPGASGAGGPGGSVGSAAGTAATYAPSAGGPSAALSPMGMMGPPRMNLMAELARQGALSASGGSYAGRINSQGLLNALNYANGILNNG